MLNIDEFKKTIATHKIILDGKEYTAKPLSLRKLMEIQELYNQADENSLGPVKALFEAVGYPADELLDQPIEVIAQVQEQLFLSIQGQQTVTQKKGPKKS
jgi:hypothetical protein